MGKAALLEVPDASVLTLVDFLLHRHTKEGQASSISLIYTGDRLEEIRELVNITTRSHYEINGFLAEEADRQEEIARLLLGRPLRISLDLEYDRGIFHIFLHEARASGAGYLSVDWEAHPESSPSEEERFSRSIGALLRSHFGLLELDSGQLPGGGRVTVDLGDTRKTVRASFGAEDEASVRAFALDLIRGLEPPSRAHVILTGTFEMVRELSESGRVIPCRGCCAWHFAYRSPAPSGTDVDILRLGEAMDLLRRLPGRDRSITFSNFTWNWDQDLDSKEVNRFIWTLSKRGEGRIEVGWYESLPRGAVDLLRKDARDFIESGSPETRQS